MMLLGAAGIAQPPHPSSRAVWWGAILAGLAAVTLVYSTFPYWAARLAFRERRRKVAAARADTALAKLEDEVVSGAIPWPNLFVYNRRQLDAYQEQSRRQQRSAFNAVRDHCWPTGIGQRRRDVA